MNPGFECLLSAPRFLYTKLVCMDANFRLKNHLVSNFSADPGLWNGMAYMTHRAPYESYVLSQADEEDVGLRCLSICIELTNSLP